MLITEIPATSIPITPFTVKEFKISNAIVMISHLPSSILLLCFSILPWVFPVLAQRFVFPRWLNREFEHHLVWIPVFPIHLFVHDYWINRRFFHCKLRRNLWIIDNRLCFVSQVHLEYETMIEEEFLCLYLISNAGSKRHWVMKGSHCDHQGSCRSYQRQSVHWIVEEKQQILI